jgi:hypothetical protein
MHYETEFLVVDNWYWAVVDKVVVVIVVVVVAVVVVFTLTHVCFLFD